MQPAKWHVLAPMGYTQIFAPEAQRILAGGKTLVFIENWLSYEWWFRKCSIRFACEDADLSVQKFRSPSRFQ
jgi:hypothetical protein